MIAALEKTKAGEGVREYNFREDSTRRRRLSKDLDISECFVSLAVSSSSQLTEDWKQRLEMSTLQVGSWEVTGSEEPAKTSELPPAILGPLALEPLASQPN